MTQSASNSPVASNEQERLAALQELAILDTSPEPAFDLITICASQIFDVPIALVSLIDKDRQWFKSCVGLDVTETPRDMAFCAHAIMRDDVLCVPDTLADSRFATNPLVTGAPYIRFYAGAPLVTASGFRLGTLCLIDTKPRPVLDEKSKSILKTLAAMVVNRLQARRTDTGTSQEEAYYLREAKQAAENAAAAKGEFLAMISHELRTPLNAIMGFSELLTNETFGPLGNPSYNEFATAIHDSGEHLRGVIATILDFTAAEQGNITLDETEFSIDEVVDKVLRLLSEKARRFHVAAGAKPMYSAPHLKADRQHVTQMLLNVVGNAIKFNRPNGTVVVSAEVGQDGSLHIYVTDSGVGISPDLIDRLQAPFAQVDGRLSRQFEGVGLGLAITRRLLALHGGSLSIQSRKGEGSCVVLHFPKERVQFAAAQISTASKAAM